MFVEYIFECHCGNAALASGKYVFALQADGPIECIGFVYAGDEEGTVPLCKLAENRRHVIGAADEHVQSRLRAAEADVCASGKNGGHHSVGAASVRKVDLDPFFFKIAERIGDVHRRIKHRVRNFTYAHLCKPFFA